MSRPRALAPLLALSLLAAGLAALPSASANTVTVFTDDFETGAPGWIADGLWHLSGVTGTSTSFWYGQEETGNYATGEEPNAGTLFSPAIDVSAFPNALVSLTFTELVEHEPDFCDFERPIIRVAFDGGEFQTVSDRCVVDAAGPVTVQFPATGSSLVVAFVWDTVDDFQNEFFGWSVDDVSISVAAAPELALNGFTIAPTPDGAAISFLASNGANADATGVLVQYALYDAFFSPIAGGTTTVDIPAFSMVTIDLGSFVLAEGDYYVEAYLDANNQFAEADEGDNYGARSFRVGPADLVAFLDHMQAGTSTFLTPGASNGGGATDQAFVIRMEVYDGGMNLLDLFEDAYNGVGSQNNAATTHVLEYPEGSYVARVFADYGGTVDESHEDNNFLEFFFSVTAPSPQLVVRHYHAPSVPSNGTLAVDVEAYNAGSTDAFGVEALVQILNATGVVAEQLVMVGDLCAGCATIAPTSFALADGEYTVLTTIDPSNVVAESDEGDNQHQTSVFVGGSGFADLVVSEFYHTPDPAGPGDFIVLHATVQNVGDGFADGSHLGAYVAWDANTEEIFAEAPVPALAPGATYFLDIPIGEAPEGTYFLRAAADIYDAVPESFEGNNDRKHTLVVGGGSGAANLVAGGIVPYASAGQAVDLVAFAANVGDVAAGDFQVDIWLDGSMVASFYQPGLGSGENATYAAAWTATPGAHEMVVVVDSYDQIAETDEIDNVLVVPFYVEPGPGPEAEDLAVTILGVDKSPVRTDLGDVRPNPAGRRTVEIAACNVGDETLAGGALDVWVEALAPKALTTTRLELGAFEVPELAAGECVSFRARWDPAGSVGDVTIVAQGYAPGDGNAKNDADAYEDFVLVGGFGGVALL